MALSRKSEITEIFERNAEELCWLAEVILGHGLDAEMCIVRAGQLAEDEGVVSRDFFEPWLRRCLVRAAIEIIRTNVQSIANDYAHYSKLAMTLPILNSTEKRLLRSIRSERLFGVCNVLERSALILHAYLGFSAQDSALLLDCHRAVIESACANALQEIYIAGFIPKTALMKFQECRPEEEQ
jgi:hypothetical protein